MILEGLWFRSTLYLVTGLLVAVWVFMLGVTLPHLSALTGGMDIFDQRLSGYDLDAARALLGALDHSGRTYYLKMQQPADTLFPALAFIVLSGWEIQIVRKLAAQGRALANWQAAIPIAIFLLAAIADYGENGAVRVLLETPVDMVTADQVARASMMTMAKFALYGVSVLLLFGSALYLFTRYRGR